MFARPLSIFDSKEPSSSIVPCTHCTYHPDNTTLTQLREYYPHKIIELYYVYRTSAHLIYIFQISHITIWYIVLLRACTCLSYHPLSRLLGAEH